MADPPVRPRVLADRLDRDGHDVHDDPYLLDGYDIIHFEVAGRAKKLYVPYETVRIEAEFGRSSEGSETTVSA